jgi:hypothetical protein
MFLLGIAFLLVPAAHVPIRIAAGVSAAAAVAAGIRRNEPHDRIGWHLLMAAVVLSDLGTAPTGDAASEAEWAAFARSVETAGATLRALTPFARERRPPALTRTAAWESFAEVTALRG